MVTLTGPRTYSAAAKVATPVSRTEFEALLAGSSGATVFQPRRSLMHAWDFHKWSHGTYSFHYCTRTGYTRTGFAHTARTFEPPVFDFYQQERVVTVELDEADLARQAAARARVFASLGVEEPA